MSSSMAHNMATIPTNNTTSCVDLQVTLATLVTPATLAIPATLVTPATLDHRPVR